MFARSVYYPLRSTAWLVFHVTFSTCSGRMSRPPSEWWGTERSGTEQADKISCKTFLDLTLNIEGDSERAWRGGEGERSVPLTDKKYWMSSDVWLRGQETAWSNCLGRLIFFESNLLVAPQGSLGAYIIWRAAGQTLLASITFSTLRNRLNPCCLWIASGIACLFLLGLDGLKIEKGALQNVSSNKCFATTVNKCSERLTVNAAGGVDWYISLPSWKSNIRRWKSCYSNPGEFIWADLLETVKNYLGSLQSQEAFLTPYFLPALSRLYKLMFAVSYYGRCRRQQQRLKALIHYYYIADNYKNRKTHWVVSWLKFLFISQQ